MEMPPRTAVRARYDFVVIGAGAAGEAAAHFAASRGASVAVVERELVGGSCPFWACMPSKTLLHDARIRALGGERTWRQASDRRDYMIDRAGTDWPDDAGRVDSLEQDGATVIRGQARIIGRGKLRVSNDGTTDGTIHELIADHIIVAVGTNSAVPPIAGLSDVAAWTNREGTSTRELPRSLLIVGGGPTGLELSQVYARFGVPVTLVHPHERLNQRDHPRNSAAVAEALRADGVRVIAGARAERVVAHEGPTGEHCVELSDGSEVGAHDILLAIGRSAPLEGLGLENAGIRLVDGQLPGDGDLRLADGVWVVGDPAGPEMHTHLAHYQGEMAVRMALGENVRPDYGAIPRVVYTDPEIAGVGLTVDEAREAGHDALEYTQDLATTAKGYVANATGHVTITLDRSRRILLGAFISGPSASEAIHEAVLAIKTRTPIDVLADTLHAFPTTARVMGTLFVEAARA
ncbi:MAG: NAD(P)/FAD-dependent oxidoreductase [Chloroflexota bacterium]|nr:NAD(P)/FAD-dependent oxidoreductase [Chloroflexota bacterium]